MSPWPIPGRLEDTVRQRFTHIGHAVIRARFAQVAGDAAQTLADHNRPGFGAKVEERDAWKLLDEQAAALRGRQSMYCSIAADLILRRRRPMRGA